MKVFTAMRTNNQTFEHTEAAVQRCPVKFTGKHLCQACNFIKKETLAQVFSCEFCEISKNTIFHRTPLLVPSEHSFQRW